MSSVTISIVIPIYNMEQQISACLDNVLRQTLPNFEIICVDDGSEDSSVQVVENYQQHYSCIRLFKQKHQYAGMARNLGIKNACGEYIAFMDADDLYMSDYALERLYCSAKEKKVMVCGGRLVKYNMENRLLEAQPHGSSQSSGMKDFIKEPLCFAYQRFIFHTEMLLRNGFEFPPYKRFQDPPFLCRVLACNRFYYVCDLDVYRYQRSNKTPSEDGIKGIGYGIADVLEMLDSENPNHFDLRLHLLGIFKQFLMNYYHYAVKTEEDYSHILWRIWKTMKRQEEYFILDWTSEEEITSSWIRTRYQYIRSERRARTGILRNADRIAIYGAGNFGQRTAMYISKMFHNKSLIFVVSNLTEDMQKVINGVPIYSIADIPDTASYLWIIAMRDEWHRAIKERLEASGAVNILTWGRKIMDDIRDESIEIFI